MRWWVQDDLELRHLVGSGWPDEAIAERMNGSSRPVFNCTARDIHGRRVKLGLLATPCKQPPWQPQLDALDAEAARLRDLIIS